MDVKQVASMVNTMTQEDLGLSVIVSEDLGNIADLGVAVQNANAYDNYVKALVNRIGKTIFVNRAYNGKGKKILRLSWEYGSVLQKVQCDLPEAEETEDWKLVDRASYDPNIFYEPKVSAKFYNNRVTFTIPMSFTEMQVKESLSNATELNAFISMIENMINVSMELKMESLIKRAVNNLIGETLYDGYQGGAFSGGSHTRAINLLYLYNSGPNYGGTPLTQAKALYDKDFLRFASQTIKLTMQHLTDISTIYNVGGKPRHTPKDLQQCWMLTNFVSALEMYLESDTFHNELVKLDGYEEISYLQGSGTDYSFGNASKINITTASGHSVTCDGIVGVIFDRDAVAVTHENKRVKENYNPRAEFTTQFYKWDAGYFNDLNENCVVFIIA